MELVSLLSEYRVIVVAGADAKDFLQAQLTCDLNSLSPDEGCFGALLNPKGKVQAAGYLLPHEGNWLMLVHPEVAEPTVTHLSRYILRAKVELGESGLFAVGLGAAKPRDGDAAEPAGGFDRLSGSSENFFNLPDGRQIGVSAEPAENSDVAAWRQADFQAGVVSVDGALHDRFIPAMLGLDTMGGVSFRKGCYPGQEIVARARHLGRVKRTLALLQSTERLTVGQELSSSDGARAGEVIDVLQTAAGWLAQAVINRDLEALSGVDSLRYYA
ncbi:MAG: hypothetical protein AAF736_16025 [Pseudomonadota bacterium]